MMRVHVVILFFSVLYINWCSAQKTLIAIVDSIENDSDLAKSVTDVKMKVKRAKDKTYTLNGTMEVLTDFAPETRVHIGIFKLRSSRWENTLIQIDKNVCEFLKNDKEYWPQVVKAGNCPKECPIKKNIYNVNNASFKITAIPPNLQPGCYKFFVQFHDKTNKLISSTIVRCRVTATGDGTDVGRCSK